MKIKHLVEEKLRDPLSLSRISQFQYLEIKKGENIEDINKEREFLICLIVEGTVCFTKNRSYDNPVIAIQHEMFFISCLECCSIKAMENSSIIVHACNIISPCLHNGIIKYLDEVDMDHIKPVEVLPIHPLMNSFLLLLIDYIRKEKEMPDLHWAKEAEFFSLFKMSYSKIEMVSFFYTVLNKKLHFFITVMTHYKVCRTARELALQCNYDEVTFSRFFKECFNETAYKWLQKQTSNEILMKLKCNDIPIKHIMLEYNFKTYSHFTTFCKRNLGATPNEIRKAVKGDECS